MKNLLFVVISLCISFATYSQNFADLVEESNKSVVTIYVIEKKNTGQGNPFTKVASEGLGSGVIVGQNSQYVLTAAHVVSLASRINVKLSDGRVIPASTSRVSDLADVAVIKLDEPAIGIPPVNIGDSDKVRIGDDIFIIGSPLGLSHSVSKGIISGKHSQTETTSDMKIMEFFQTDAAINKGNSGGPMFNMDGEVIGIASSILSFSGGFEGLGFVASSNIARKMLSQQSSIWFGLDALPLSQELCAIFNVPQNGALMVQNVAKGSPGYFMGLRGGYRKMVAGNSKFLAGGDIILKFDHIELNGMEKIEEFRSYLNSLEKYHEYKVKVLRNGKIKTLNWKLME